MSYSKKVAGMVVQWEAKEIEREQKERANWERVVYDNVWHNMRGAGIEFPGWCGLEGSAEDIEKAILDIQARLCALRDSMPKALAELQAITEGGE